VFVVEDDDTACEIKANRDIIGNLFKAVDGAYKALTAGNDSSNTVAKAVQACQRDSETVAALASFFNTNDELVGRRSRTRWSGISYPATTGS